MCQLERSRPTTEGAERETHDGLLPVGVAGVRAGRELDRLEAAREVNVEPGEESVDVVVAGGSDGKVGGKGEVLLLDGPDVNVLDLAGLGDDRLEVDCVDEGLAEGNLLDARVVEAVDVVPKVDLLLLVLLVLDGGDVHRRNVGEDEAALDLREERAQQRSCQQLVLR